MLEKYLEDLEKRIDSETEDKLLSEWREFTDGKFRGDIFCPQRTRKIPSKIKWPKVTVNQALFDVEQMLLQQFSACSYCLENAGGAIMNVRSNYGSSIIPSVLGAEDFIMADELNTLPTTKPLNGGKKTIMEMIKKGVPDLNTGCGAKVFETGKRFVEILKDYPKARKYIKIYHPDFQGPLDNCEVLWGSELFIDIIDEPQLVKDFLSLITETYTALMKKWTMIVPFEGEYSTHWNMLHKGHIMLRIDSAMNISPEMYGEFVVPYDQKLLDIFGGGGIHFCGRGDHYIEQLSKMKGVYAVPMSQPHLNDMDKIYRNTVDKGIKLIGFSRDAAEKALAAGRNLRGNVHCWEAAGKNKQGGL
ncbi:MAG: hypothetical protein A2017_04145 [Lentisphaerae bacterium GWF2_44_16]|nr:MAG: hypothetical protein A2017_04145 [Lentisphaerae bacterium GWF2_44_16]